MSYLPKDKRRAQIVGAAVELMTREGLAAATVRGVATAINASPGQIHHHFASADALRAEAFREFGRRLSCSHDARHCDLSPVARVLAILICENRSARDIPVCEKLPPQENLDRLWKEAVAASHMDALIREAVGDVLEDWRRALAEALSQMLAARGQDPATDLTLASRRLIGHAIGCDLVSDFAMDVGASDGDVMRYVELELELALNRQKPEDAHPLPCQAPAAG